MGGTFDPIHYGHLVAAEAARVRFGLSEVIFVPSGDPPHKQDREVAAAEDRYLMAMLATSTNPFFWVSRCEIDRPGPSYTADTVEAMRQEAGPAAALYFITGADAVMELMTWHRPQAILEQCELIAATRPGYPPTDEERLRTTLRDARVHTITVPALAISSSDIRRRVKGGEPIKYLVPETVEQYILKSGLYAAAGREHQECGHSTGRGMPPLGGLIGG